ncbi:MAG: SIR2 family protein, partial [Psychrilyobacter sp.]|uniref:SIR2 family protein n=1 Tax=Psychrilyobacter sp. TaxID=2586924 RepID=UPI003C72130D
MGEYISDLTLRMKEEDISFIKMNEEKLIREINDLKDRKLILFLGAGVSKSYGLKNWNEVAEELIAKLYKSNQRKFNEHQISLISNYNESEVKKKILLAEKILNAETSNGNDYYKVLENCMCYLEEGKILNGYKEKNKDSTTILDEIREILKLKNSMCLTTNIDRLIEIKLELAKKEMSIGNKGYGNENKKLYKIHGCITKRDTIVFTPKEYFKFYNNQRQINKLKEKMKSSVVIFIGKEIEDEIIQAFFYEKKNTEKEDKKSVYLIKSYNSVKDFDLKPTLEIEKEYYNHYDITLLPYDEYNHLPNYIKRIKKEINLIKEKKIEYELTSFNIDRLDSEKDIKKMQEIANAIQNNKFKNLEETNKENYEDIKKFINENYVELLENTKIYNRHNFIIELTEKKIEEIWSGFDFENLNEFCLINLIKRSLTINETKLEKLLNSLINKGRYN